MSLQLVHGKRLAFEVDDQRCSGVAVERELGPALQITLQVRGQSYLDRRTAGLADRDHVVRDRDFAEPQRADRLCRAAGAAQLSQQLLLAAEKSLAKERQPERFQAPGGLARKGFGKRPPIIDRRLDLSRRTSSAIR